MANEVTRVPGVAEQVWLVAGLRWRMYRNSLQTLSGKLDVAANAAIGILSGVLALLIGSGIGAAAFFIAQRGRLGNLTFLFWGIFLAWQLLPILMVTFSQDFDARNLMRFPLRFPAYFTLSLVYALFDPVTLVTLIWLGCLCVGIVLARPEVWATTIAAALLLALASLLLNRVIFSWLEKWLAKRRTRETILAVVLMGMIVVQLGTPYVVRSSKRAAPYLLKLRPVAAMLPPGLAGGALAATAESDLQGMVEKLLLLAVYPAGLGLLLGRRLRQQYAGEELGETERATESIADLRANATKEAGWNVPGVSSAVAAIFEKELRYFLRNKMTLMNAVLPVILVLFFAGQWFGPQDADKIPPLMRKMPDIAFPSAVAYMVLLLAQMAYNSFAFDGWGVQVLYAAPVRFREVLLGKNLAYGSLVVVDTVLVLAVLAMLGRPVGAMMVAVTLAGLLFVMVTHFAVGNAMSICFPRAYDFARMRQRARGTTVLVYLLAQIFTMGIAGIVVGIAASSRQLAVALLIFLLLDVGVVKAYQMMLERCEDFARDRREQLISELCK